MSHLFKIKGLFLRLLPHSIFYLLGKCLGVIWFYIFRIRRDVAVKNIMLALQVTQREAEEIALNSFINITTSFLEFISQRKAIVTYKHLEEIERLKDSGVIIVTAHTGNWDVLERAAIDTGFKIGIISRKTSLLPLQRFLKYIREKRGEIIFDEDTKLSQLSGFIKAGGKLCLVIDQNMPPRRGRPATFFLQQVSTTYAPQILQIRTGAPILPVFIRRIKENIFEIEFYRSCVLKDDSDTSIFESMNDLNRLLEEFIKKCPDQWFWVHRRFKPLK